MLMSIHRVVSVFCSQENNMLTGRQTSNHNRMLAMAINRQVRTGLFDFGKLFPATRGKTNSLAVAPDRRRVKRF